MVLGIRSSAKLKERAERASSAIDKRIQIIRTRIKQPKQMQRIDKLTFVFGVVLMLVIQNLFISEPQYISTLFLFVFPPLMAIRYVDFHRKKWHYFLLDFCYFANTLLFIFLSLYPTNKTIFTVLFVWANGPLLFANIMWRTAIVFHSLPHITTNFIHIYPTIAVYAVRWYPTDAQRESLCVADGCGLTFWDLMGWPMALYIVWQGLYLLKTEWLDSEKLKRDTEIGTSFRHLINFYQNHFLGKVAMMFGERYATAMFVLMQLIYTAIVSLPVYFAYRYKYVHLFCIIAITIISLWNGAGYYIFKLSQSSKGSNPAPDSPEPSEVWFRRYIRRGPSASVSSSVASAAGGAAAVRALKRGASVTGRRKMSIDDVYWENVVKNAVAGADGKVSADEVSGKSEDGLRRRAVG